MQIRSLKLKNFRNYEKLDIKFSKNLNIIYGLNGMGKTNIIESIYVLALTKSFRTNNEKLLIKSKNESLTIEGEIKDLTVSKHKIIINKEGKKALINNNKISRLSDYISKFSVILFNPDDLRIIKDSPSVRRKALNMELSQLDNKYLKSLNIYNKILKQRNSYLKTLYTNGNASKSYIDILTNELVDIGLKIYEIRKDFFAKINDQLSIVYEQISNKKNLYIKYESDFENNKEEILIKYKTLLNKDVILGKTNFGIHLDDYIFNIADENLKDFGSEGQQKNAIIAYKLTELEIFKEKKGSYPVLILDDLFSELDQNKIKNIMNHLKEQIQIFITTTEISKINKKIREKSQKIKIKNGSIEVK